MTTTLAVAPRASTRQIGMPHQAGLTIIEMMISLALGLIVVLAATTLLLSTKSGYVMEDDATRINDTGRYVAETISRAVRQVGFRNWDQDEGPVLLDTDIRAGILGLNAKSLKANSIAIESPVASTVNGSDVLAVRFFGTGPDKGDGSTVNCAGFSVGAAASADAAQSARGWSIFFVGKDATGEPELRCKYEGKSGWTADAIARGVESFQVLYGLDTDGDGLPNQFLDARAVTAKDDAAGLPGIAPSPVASSPVPDSAWANIVVIKVALLIRGTQNMPSDKQPGRFDLFGSGYTDAHAASDAGTMISEMDLPVAVRNRMRKVFSFSIQLRQPVQDDKA